MPKCIPRNVLDTRARHPCCGMQWPGQKLFLDLLFHYLTILLGAKLLSKAHFIKLMNACLIEIKPHIDSGKYPPKCPIFYFSTQAPRHFASTSGPFSTYPFFDSNKHNYCKWLQYIWRLSNRRIRPSWETLNTSRIFLSAVRSSRWCYRVHIIWWRCVNILNWQFQRGFYSSRGLLGICQGLPCTCLTFEDVRLFLKGFRFFI